MSEVARILIYDQIKFLLDKGVIRGEYDESGEGAKDDEDG